jgi:hypothetical protein
MKTKTLRKSGGLGAFIKSSIIPFIAIIEIQSDNIVWLKLSNKFCGLDNDIIIGTIHIPPMQSRYYSND